MKKPGIAHADIPAVNLAKLKPVGSYPDTMESAARKLARAIHFAESTNCAVSWSAQERAQNFINTNGLSAALTEAHRLELEELENEE